LYFPLIEGTDYETPMTDGTVDSGIEFDIASLLSEDVFEVEEDSGQQATQSQQTNQSESLRYHELKSKPVVVVGRWVDILASRRLCGSNA
jgi:hypothetical protein